MRIDELVTRLAKLLAIETIEFDPEGFAQIFVDDVNINLIKRGSALILQTKIADPLEDEFEQTRLLRQLLRIQAARTGDPWQARETLTVDPANRDILVVRSLIAEETDDTNLNAALEDFVNASELWRAIATENKVGV